MQVFKVFFKVMRKHKATLFIYVAIYMGISFAVSGSLQESGQMQFSKISLKIGVENRDQGELGNGLVSYLKIGHQIKEAPKNRELLQDAMYYQELDYVLVIPEDFTEKFPSGAGVIEGTAVPGSNSAFLVENEIQQYLDTAAMYRKAGIELERAASLAAKDMEQKAKVDFLEENDGQSLPKGFYFFQYIPYVFLVLMILGLGTIMKTFQDKNLSARHKCSSMSFFWQNFQIILGCILFTLMVFLVFMGMAACFTPEYFFSFKGILSAANVLSFSVCAAGVAWFCVQFAKSMQELNVMSNIFSLSFSFLGGVFVSLELMGDKVRLAAKFIPSYWYVIANEKISRTETLDGALDIVPCYLIILAFALAFISAGLFVNRMKLRSV